MKKYLLSMLVSTLLISPCVSQETTDSEAEKSGWKLELDANLSATQATYSNNWSGGELGSFNWTFTSNSSAEKQLSPKLNNRTALKLSFGQTHTQLRGEDGNSHWQRPEKSTDLIDLESVLRFTLNGLVDPYVAGRFESQFYDGSVRQLKRYLSPAKFTESGGLLRVFAENENKLTLKSRFGFALRQIRTSNIVYSTPDVIDYTIGPTNTTSTNDGGIESVTDLDAKLNDKLKYVSKLSMYKALFFSESDLSTNDDWKAVDVNWEHILTAQLAKFLQMNMYLQFLYDKELDKGVRIKETLGLGFSVKVL